MVVRRRAGAGAGLPAGRGGGDRSAGDLSRFLFVVPPLTGHTNPTLGVAEELTRRGHAVAWTGYASVLRPLLPAGASLIPAGEEPAEDDPGMAAAKERSQGLRGIEALKFLWEDFILPLGRAMVPGVDTAVDQFRPDVLIVDQQAIAGAVVARRRGLPWATSATTSAELVDPFAALPKLGEWVVDQLESFEIRFGGGGAGAGGDIRFSEHLVIAFSTEALAGPGRSFPGHYLFVGPSLGTRPAGADFPWERLDASRRRVLVSLGTINGPGGARFLGEAVAALGAMSERVQGIVVAPVDLLGVAVPDNVVVRSFVPQLELLAHVDAVVCHGGHNTVCEALSHGLPLVVAPIRDDQPIVAQQLTDSGAAFRVRFGRVHAGGPGGLVEAITAVLDDPSYREAAGRLQASFAAAGGPAAAAAGLETLAAPRGQAPSRPGRPILGAE